MRRALIALSLVTAALLIALPARAQWVILSAPTTSDLRGIDNVGEGIAWASGSEGAVLRTVDYGSHWELCASPPNAEHLDFRGIQAFDASTAIVMSSGKGPLSRLYKTTDACRTWKLVATNPEKEGFFDSVQTETDSLGRDEPAPDPERAMVLGDSVGHKMQIWEWKEGWEKRDLELYDYTNHQRADDNETSFAASNSVLQVVRNFAPETQRVCEYKLRWSSGTPAHAYISMTRRQTTPSCTSMWIETVRTELPMSQGSTTAGVFSFGFRDDEATGVAVGGDFEKPTATFKTAAFTADAGNSWALAQTPPHGFRSAVAYDAGAKMWVTVGPNGTDISTDDGRNWRALWPAPGDAPGADRDWNALSLPFVVGPHGRIGMLRLDAFTAAAK